MVADEIMIDFLSVTSTHIRHSNLIEGVNDTAEDEQLMRAWVYLAGQVEITLQAIFHAHFMITKNTLGNDAGKFRRNNVQIRMSGKDTFYYPPTFEHVSGLMSEWINKMQTCEMFEPKAMHIEFEMIHPFRDGNGRIGRLLMWWHEINNGVEPTLILVEDKLEYYKWFTDYEDVSQ